MASLLFRRRRPALPGSMSRAARRLRVGDLVRIRTEPEILVTLDVAGKLDGIPFMPEMAPWCGQIVRVYRRVDKTCVPGWSAGLERLDDTVLLEDARCDGSAHGSCDAGCLFLWKESWLEPVIAPVSARRRAAPTQSIPSSSWTPEEPVRVARVSSEADGEPFSCQATELHGATRGPLPAWDVRQYVRDVGSGNVAAGHAALIVGRGFVRKATRHAAQAAIVGERGGARHPAERDAGVVRSGDRVAPGLGPGDRVRVRSWPEIEATIDEHGQHRGLSFRPEMRRYCGREYRVLKRVERIISERTGRIVNLRDTVVLDGINCDGDFHRFCPRSIHLYWRSVWLERLDTEAQRE